MTEVANLRNDETSDEKSAIEGQDEDRFILDVAGDFDQ